MVSGCIPARQQGAGQGDLQVLPRLRSLPVNRRCLLVPFLRAPHFLLPHCHSRATWEVRGTGRGAQDGRQLQLPAWPPSPCTAWAGSSASISLLGLEGPRASGADGSHVVLAQSGWGIGQARPCPGQPRVPEFQHLLGHLVGDKLSAPGQGRLANIKAWRAAQSPPCPSPPPLEAAFRAVICL